MRREKTAIRDALLFWRGPGESGQERSGGAPVTDGQCLDDVAEVVVEGVVSLGEDGRIVEANRTFASTFGYEPSAVVGKAFKDFVAPVSREPVEKSLSVGLEKPFKAVGVKKDGTPVNVEMRAEVSAPRGRAVSVVAVREVTEREEAEERLRRVEASYRNLVEQIPAVTYTQDPDSGHHFASVYLSPQAEQMLGYTREEFASDAGLWVSLIHPEDRERVLAEDARTDETGEPFRMEYRLVARDGRVVWVRDEAVLVRGEDGSSVCWQGVMTEVTSRKLAEEALKESEERFRSVVQNSSDIVTMIGADGTIRYVSPAIERVLGYRPEEKVGTSILDLVHPDDADRASGIFAEILERPGLNAQLEFRVPHKDGSWRYLEHVANNLLDDPAVGKIVVNSRDVTERKRMSEALEQSEERYRRQARDLALLHQVRTALAQELELSDVFRTIVEAIAEAYGYTQVSAYLLEGEELVLQHQVGYHQVIERIPVTEGVSGRAVRTGRPILLEDVGADPDFLGAIEGLTSEICVPLFDGGEVVGFFNVESMGGVRLTHDDLELMVALGEHVSVAVSRARLYTRVRESEERFRSMVQNSSDIITLVGADGAVRYVSPAIERVLGYRPEERVGKHALDLVHPEDLERARRAFAEVLTSPGLTTSMAMWVRHNDGSWRHIETTGTNRLDEQGVDAVVLNSRDVTERKGAEEALRESEQRFRNSFEDAAIGMALLTPDGRYLRANRSLCEMLGYTQEELLNMTFRDITHPDDLEDDLALGSRVLEGETRSFSMRKRYITKDGVVVWVDLTASLLRSDSGEPLYSVAQIQDVTERVRAEDALRQAEERYRTLVEQIPAVTYVDSADGSDEPLYTSPQIEEMLGYTPEEWLGGRLWAECLHPDDKERVLAADERFEAGAEERFGEEYRLLAKDGSVVWVREEAVLIEDEAGEPLFWQGVILDITKRKEAEEALRESEQRFRSAFDDAGIGMTIATPDGRYMRVNRAFCGMVGYAEDELLGMTFRDITHPDDLEEDLRLGRGVLAGEDRSYSMEKRYVRKDGSVVWVHLTVSLLRGPSAEPLYSIAQAQDITGRKRTEERLKRRALHDPLTGLPNRTLFVDRLGHALERTRRRRGRKVAVLFMDLDGFKVVNDSLGHEAGDLLLTVVAQRLRRCLRPEDTLARFGGDEFVVLLEEVERPQGSILVAERIAEELRRPFAVEGRELFASASIGIAVGDVRTKTSEDLLRDADTAMYRAKDTPADYRMFDPAMYQQAKGRLELENDLRRAIERDEFVVHYQPIVDLETDGIWGVEALVRWDHPERGLLDPSRFIAVVEESGLIVPLGERVLEEACRQAKGWQDDPRIPPLVVSVNLSARQLGRPDLFGAVVDSLRKSGLDARRLSLDITETAYIRVLEEKTAALERLKDMGISISIDDFGVGYSSLSYLKRLPADALKIDLSFVRGIGEDAGDTAIVRMVIDLAHTLGMKVVAEGVEGWTQAALLREMGCDLAQGFYFARPLPPEEVSRFLAR